MLLARLKDIVSRYPNNIAIQDDIQSITYVELGKQAYLVSKALTEIGIGAGERVCLLSENSVNAVSIFWGIVSCNAISVGLNEQTPVEGLVRIISDAKPSLVIVSEKQNRSQRLRKAVSELSIPVLTVAELMSVQATNNIKVDNTKEKTCSSTQQVATIVYTSGSTGEPKGVCLTHTNLLSVAKMAGDDYDIAPSDRYLMVVPLHYIHGLMILMTMCLRGARIYFMNSFVFPKLVTQRLEQMSITGFSGVPYHLSALVEKGGLLAADLPALRWVGITGGRCSADLIRRIRHGQPRVNIHISYGMTECSPRVSALHPSKIDVKPDSVGHAAEGVCVEFLDAEGNVVTQGQPGELVVSGPNVMYGYWEDEVATSRVIDSQGRLHTGDYAYVDEDGDIFIQGRIQAMIKTAGERIFPEEIESVLHRCDDVIDAVVVGIPDKRYGQRVEAHVILLNDSEESLTRVKKYCLSHMAFARSPRKYQRWREFPVKANGKVDKSKLILSSEVTSALDAT